MNTKPVNNYDKHIAALITMHWQWVYARNPSERSIYESTCNQNFHLIEGYGTDLLSAHCTATTWRRGGNAPEVNYSW